MSKVYPRWPRLTVNGAFMAAFLAGVSPDIPWHLTAFHPDYRMTGPPATPPHMLERAKRRVSQKRLSHVTHLEIMDARDIKYPDNSFDAVVAAYVMSVVPESLFTWNVTS